MFAPPIAKAKTQAATSAASNQPPVRQPGHKFGPGASWDFGSISIFQPKSRGEPLEAKLRARFATSRKGDLSEVRIHRGAEAAEAAKVLHARAFTVGHEIYFNAGRYRPDTAEGVHLLAHEVAHVVQQRPGTVPRLPLRISQPGEPSEQDADQIANDWLAGRAMRRDHPVYEQALYRAPEQQPGAPSPTVATNPESIIRQWLDQHQFAPPDKQPDEEPDEHSGPQSDKPPEEQEKHVLLNGEEMTVSEAVKLAAAGTSQAPERVKSVIMSMLVPLGAAALKELPLIGPGNLVPGIGLNTKRDAFGMNPAIAKTVEYSTIDDYLAKHNFSTPAVREPSATKVLFDDKETTIDWVVDRAMALLGQYPSLTRAEVVTRIRQKYVEARGGPGNQIVFGYTLVPAALQYVGGSGSPSPATQHQFSFTITRQHHANDSPGLETSFQGSVSLSNQGIVNLQAGGQEAIVWPLLKGWIQVSGLVQVMAAANWNQTATGQTVITPSLQATGGGQALLTPAIRSGDWKFLTGHLQLGVQVLGGAQTSSTGTVAVGNAGFVLNIPISL